MTRSTTKLKYLTELLIAAIICIAIWFVIVHHLDFDSMWDDEHYTWRISREGPFHLVPETGLDIHPPAHYLWVWFWHSWMGGSDNLFVIRLSSTITSLLTVAVTYRLGTEWFRSRWVGLGAALFIGTSGVFVFYARDLRMYSLITLLAALSWLMLKRQFNQQRGGLLGYAAAVALMAYTFYSAVFIVVVQFVVVFAFYRQHLRRVLLAYGIAFTAFLP
jgi:mannosyltransferase